MTARPVETVLSRLRGVREVGPGRWTALCPAHEDRSPSLSIRETSNGTVLLKCHAGCPTAAVLTALGLSWRDLFSAPLPGRGGRLTRAEREAARRAEVEAELRRRIETACDELHRRLCVYVRAVNFALLDADFETYEKLAYWVHRREWLEHLLDSLESRDAEAQLWALREGTQWIAS